MNRPLILGILLSSTLAVSSGCGDGCEKGEIKDDSGKCVAEDPDLRDDDGDGLLNGDEESFGTDPAVADTDEDGMSDLDEFGAGTDGTNPDTDGDRLIDGAEATAGTDPLAPDSDGDSYMDGDEVAAGSDPTDASSLLYIGGWPFNPDKDAIDDPGWSGNASVGATVPRFAWVDQFGQVVDIYDFANPGKPIVMDLSGLWCVYCREVAAWLDHDQSSMFYDYPQWDPIVQWVANGTIYWVTVVDSNRLGGPADEETAAAWFDSFPNERIAVLSDVDQQLVGWLNTGYYPTIWVVNPDMTVAYLNINDYTKAWDYLLDNVE